MSAEKHPAYIEELERCRYTLNYVEKSLSSAISRKEKLDRDLENIKRHFNSGSSTDYANLRVNELLKDSFYIKVKNLKTAKGKPYFARIDFKEKGAAVKEKLYIGKLSLMRDEDQQIIIVDWRAPIANLYYEGRLGECSYNCPGGKAEGQLLLKRQLSINDGELQEIFDIDITTNDEFLQSYLGAGSDNRLKEIVSTIQTEQNEIIRADMWTPLIVQGVAGSGKTTIALHRIAYLIYTYEKSFEPDKFMIIAPNRLFLNYISEVLPELGVEKVKQTTFEDFAMELLGKKFKIRDANEKLNNFVNNNADQSQANNNGLLKICSELKTSMAFKRIIDEYIEAVEKNFIPRENFKVGSKVVFKYEEINNLFINELKMWPIVKRLDELKKYLSTRLKQRRTALINYLHMECDMKIKELKETMPDTEERQTLIIEAIDKQNEAVGKLDAQCKNAVSEYIKRISKLSPFEYYKDFITDEDIFNKIMKGKVDEKTAEFFRQYTKSTLDSGFVEIEDLAPITYLKFCIYGIDEKIPVRHIVIDEAQDFSVFQLYVLKRIIKDSSFTILGDLCQGIHSYRGTRDWNELMGDVFFDRGSKFLTLEESYRTTVEIMEAANKVMGFAADLAPFLGKPVIRHGEEVKIFKTESLVHTADDIVEKINSFRKTGLRTVAVICKTMEECKTMHQYLKKDLKEITVITGKEEVYRSGLVIVPSYLSKGLEFDVVIIANANSEQYKKEDLDMKLLYVSMTRPLHKLYIYYHGEISPLLEGA